MSWFRRGDGPRKNGMKFFHNTTIGKMLVVGYSFAVHAAFALNAFPLGLLVMGIVLYDMPYLVPFAAVGYCALVFAGAVWGFIYFEYAREDVKAFNKWYLLFLYLVQIAIAANELASLALRAYDAPNVFYRDVVIAVGLLALLIAYCLGKVMHAMANKPVEASLRRVWQETGRSIVDDALTYVPQMSVAQKKRFYNGDVDVIDEVRGATEAERDAERRRKAQVQSDKARQQEEEQAAREAAQRQEDVEKQRASAFTGQILSYPQASFPKAQAMTQASRLGQNGRGNH